MKIITFNFIFTLFLFYNEFSFSSSTRNTQFKNSTLILTNKELSKESTQNEYLNLQNELSSAANEKSVQIAKTINNLRNYHDSLEEHIKNFEGNTLHTQNIQMIEPNTQNLTQNEIYKIKQHRKTENKFMFYNSLSLIMLSMIAGGLVGIVFVLYFSFKKDENDLY